jgi:hypothetical protein
VAGVAAMGEDLWELIGKIPPAHDTRRPVNQIHKDHNDYEEGLGGRPLHPR